MKRPLLFVCVIIIVCIAGLTCTHRAVAKPAGDSPSTSQAGDDFFPITAWELPFHKKKLIEAPGSGIDSMRDCGFTAAAFVTPDQLPLCEKLGMRALVAPNDRGLKHWRDMSDAQIRQYVTTLVDQSKHSTAVMGFFLTDEPGVRDFPALAKAVTLVKQLAPGKLAYINLLPNYATLGAPDLSQLGTPNYTEYLERYITEVKPQFISYDNYQVLFSDDLKNEKRAASYFTNLVEVRRVAMEHHLPFWNIVSSNEIRPKTPIPSPANFQMQAYTSLAAGARGLTWFTYYTKPYHYGPIDENGHRTSTWSYLRMVNERVKTLGPIMNRLTSTGVYFTMPLPDPSLPALPGKLVQSVDSPTPLMVGEFTNLDTSAHFILIVNLSLERSTKVTLKLQQPTEELRIVSPVDGSRATTQASNGLWLTAGEGMLIELH